VTCRASAWMAAGAGPAPAHLTSPQADAVLAAIGQVEARPEDAWTDEEQKALGRARDKVQGAVRAAPGSGQRRGAQGRPGRAGVYPRLARTARHPQRQEADGEKAPGLASSGTSPPPAPQPPKRRTPHARPGHGHADARCRVAALIAASLLPAAAAVVFDRDEDTVTARAEIIIVSIRGGDGRLPWCNRRRLRRAPGRQGRARTAAPALRRHGCVQSQLQVARPARPGRLEAADDGTVPAANLPVLPVPSRGNRHATADRAVPEGTRAGAPGGACVAGTGTGRARAAGTPVTGSAPPSQGPETARPGPDLCRRGRPEAGRAALVMTPCGLVGSRHCWVRAPCTAHFSLLFIEQLHAMFAL